MAAVCAALMPSCCEASLYRLTTSRDVGPLWYRTWLDNYSCAIYFTRSDPDRVDISLSIKQAKAHRSLEHVAFQLAANHVDHVDREVGIQTPDAAATPECDPHAGHQQLPGH
jgi:hypothetical protein